MKKLSLILALLLVVSLNVACDTSGLESWLEEVKDFFTFGCDVSGPESTVRRLVDAYNSKDWVEYAGCFVSDSSFKEFRDYTEAYRKMRSVAWSTSPASWMLKLEWTNLETEVVSRDSDTATVSMDFDVELTVFGNTDTVDHWTQSVHLEKIDGEWLIANIARE